MKLLDSEKKRTKIKSRKKNESTTVFFYGDEGFELHDLGADDLSPLDRRYFI